MTTPNIDVNSGTEALLGFEFQRNCALLLLLDNYKSYIDKNYFISIEHYDDFLFGFRDAANQQIEYIKSYQAKKLSGSKWTISALAEPTGKMLDVGASIHSDIAGKAPDFRTDLIFVSDRTIELKSDNLNKDNNKKATYDIESIKVDSPYVPFKELSTILKGKIRDSVNDYSEHNYDDIEFDALGYEWVDLPKTPRNQLAILETRVGENFDGVPDTKAALYVLLSLFKHIETTYNKRKKISLLDESKILEGDDIQSAVKVINLESRTLEFWRKSAEEFCPKLKLPVGKSNKASEYIGIAFELFKDLNNQEHKNIFNFVRDNNFEDYCYNSPSTIEMFVDGYYNSNIFSNSIEREDVIFAIVCAYVETRNIQV